MKTSQPRGPFLSSTKGQLQGPLKISVTGGEGAEWAETFHTSSILILSMVIFGYSFSLVHLQKIFPKLQNKNY